MKTRRDKKRRWIAIVLLGVIGLIPASLVDEACADDRRALCGKTVDEWIKTLHDQHGKERIPAIWMLGQFGPEATAAVPELVGILQQVDRADRTGVKDAVIRSLGQIGPGAATAIPLLAKEFRTEECYNTKQGTFGVSLFGGPRHALIRIGAPSVPELMEAMETLDGERRPCAAEALGKIGPSAKAAVPMLVRALHVERPQLDFNDNLSRALRRDSIFALERIGPDAEAAVDALNVLLDASLDHDQDQWSDHAFEVVRALDSIGAPPLAKLLEASRRRGITGYLSDLSPKARAAVTELKRLLFDERIKVRVDAAEALAAIDPTVAEAVPVLIDAMIHHSDEFLFVPETLVRFGTGARSAIPALLARLEPGACDTRAIRALVQIDPEGQRCVSALIRALSEKEPDVVFAASESLGLLGHRASAAVPAFVKVLQSPISSESEVDDPKVSAIKSLMRIDPHSPPVIPALIECLDGRKTKIRGPAGEEVDAREWSTAEAAAEALGSLGPPARAAVPALIKILQGRYSEDGPYYTTVGAAALALGRIGVDSRPAIPILREMSEEKNDLMSGCAAAALSRLVPDGEAQAMKWLEKPLEGRVPYQFRLELEGRAVIFGVMGRTSLEADALVREDLEYLDMAIEGRDREPSGNFPDWIIERLGRFGAGGRLAIPRVEELRRDRDPWIRRTANETLAGIRMSTVRPSSQSLPPG